jgi:hypothetical protein
MNGRKLEELLSSIRDSPVLTIGEGERFIHSGGTIHLFEEDGRLIFEIHLGVLQDKKLNISSKLLRLGYTVRDQNLRQSGKKVRP